MIVKPSRLQPQLPAAKTKLEQTSLVPGQHHKHDSDVVASLSGDQRPPDERVYSSVLADSARCTHAIALRKYDSRWHNLITQALAKTNPQTRRQQAPNYAQKYGSFRQIHTTLK